MHPDVHWCTVYASVDIYIHYGATVFYTVVNYDTNYVQL